MESRNSFHSRMECCCGLPAEKGCFIFSIINMIIVSTCLAACIYYIGYVEYLKLRHIDGLETFFHEIFCTIVSVCTGICFLFAVLLCYGAHKKRPKFIIAYFVFGIIVEILSTAGAIYYLMVTDPRDVRLAESIFDSVVFIIIAMYPLALTVVYRAYRVLSDTTVLPSGHSKLVNYPVI